MIARFPATAHPCSGTPSRAGLSGQVCEAPYGKP